jgi:hypothetical protein
MMIADSANAELMLRLRYEWLELNCANLWLASVAMGGIAQGHQCSSAVTSIRTAAAVQASHFAASSSAANALDR